MFDTQTLLVFAIPTLVLLAVPGPAIAYLAARSFAQGPIAGVVSSLGLCGGLFVHVILSVAGVASLAAQWPLALRALQITGGVYLLWLGFVAWRSQENPTERDTVTVAPRPLRRLFWDGVLVNVLNPKPALFFLAFLPQFVDLGLETPVRLQLAGLGIFLVALGFLINSTYAIVFGLLGRKLQCSARVSRLQQRFSGGFLFALGLWALFNGLDSKPIGASK